MGNKAVLSTSHGGCLTPVELETCGVTESGELTLEEAAAKYKMPAAVWTRPATAHGTFLRIITVNDVYKLENYPNVATAVFAARAASKLLDGVVISTLPGDFLSPCTLTSLDGGRAMMKALNIAQIDFACLGNHEFDLGFAGLESILQTSSTTKIINSNVDDKELQALPKYVKFLVGKRSCVLGGFSTDDTSIYPPSTKPSVRPVIVSCAECWEAAKVSEPHAGKTPDLFVPMTHQLTKLDRETGVALAKHDELKSRTPVVLAAHDHEVFIEEAGNSVVVKVGADASNIGIIDIWWNQEEELKSSVTMLPASEFPQSAPVASFVEEQRVFLEKMMDVPIASLPAEGLLSSKKVRFEESAIATFLLSFVKRGLAQNQVEVAMIQGGAVRAGKIYNNSEKFLMGDLFQEFAFDCHQAIIKVPGHIIAASIQSTRSAPKPAANFLHLDDGCKVQFIPGTNTHTVTHLDGKPIDPNKLYSVAIYQFLLTGLNVIEPLLSYVKANVEIPDQEACRPVKDIVMECCMKDAWRQVVGLEKWDGLHTNARKKEEFQQAIRLVFDEIDTSNDGFIHPDELEKYVEEKQNIHNHGLIVQMMKTLDENGDGKISLDELSHIAI